MAGIRQIFEPHDKYILEISLCTSILLSVPHLIKYQLTFAPLDGVCQLVVLDRPKRWLTIVDLVKLKEHE